MPAEYCARLNTVPRLLLAGRADSTLSTLRALSLEEESEQIGKARGSVRAESKGSDDTPLASKSFFKADTIQVRWSPAGQAVLIQTSTESDAR